MAEKASCLENTRAQLLDAVTHWMNDDKQKSIYVLYGIAGIGKSTVAKTVAERAADYKILGASFFFSRGEERRNTGKSLFPTLAYYLAHRYPELAVRINDALEENHDVVQRDLRIQFDLLIAKPLQRTKVQPKPILIVIDALDECNEQHAGSILSLLSQNIRTLPFLKVFITARPEQHIRRVLDEFRDHERFYLHDIEDSVVEADIRLYINFRLSKEEVQKVLRLLPPPLCMWQPTEEEKDKLVRICGKLFIVASTAASFILDDRLLAPARQLALLLDGVSATDSSGFNMDHVYMQIINAARSTCNPINDWVDRFQIFVGTIALLRDPLPCEALARLLRVNEEHIVQTLENLHSLLAPGGSRTYRIHHKSFPDFITDRTRCTASEHGEAIFINPIAHHLRLTKCCLRIMNRELKQNLCGLEPHEMYRDRAQLYDHIHGRVLPHLAYACTYWASHLEASVDDDTGLDAETRLLIEQFASTRLFAWLEALSIIERVDTAYSSLDIACRIMGRIYSTQSRRGIVQYLRKLFRGSSTDIALGILNDGCRLVQRSSETIRLSPMNIYHSSLPFTPQRTALFRSYRTSHVNNVHITFGFEEAWNPAIAVLRGHSNSVQTAVFSADATRLASASYDTTVRLWDGRTGGHIATLAEHSHAVRSTALSSNGSRLASASEDGTVRLWDGRTGGCIGILEGHSDLVSSVTFSVDGLRLASASEDETVRLWDSRTGSHIGTFSGHSRPVASIIFSPDGSKLASASHDTTVRLWDVMARNCISTLKGHSGSVLSVTFSPDGSVLASASRDKTVRLWSSTGISITTLNGHSRSINSVIFSPDGSQLASASWDTTVRLWGCRAGNAIAALRGHSSWVSSVAYSADGARLASASGDHTIRVWDSKSGNLIIVLRGHSSSVESVAYSQDGSRLASASRDATVRLWDGRAGGRFATHEGHLSLVSSVTFSADGSRLASASHDRTVRLWNGRTGRHIVTLKGHSGPVDFVTFSPLPNCLRLASGSRDKTVRLWDGKAGTHLHTLEGHSDWINSVAFSTDGISFASASEDKTLRVWNGTTCCRILRGHLGPVASVTFSPDGSILASASWDKTARLWDRRGNPIATLDSHSSSVESVMFSPDGSKLASMSADRTLRLWDGRTGSHIATFDHADPLKYATFLSSGLASLSQNGTVQLWKTDGPENRSTITSMYKNTVRDVAFLNKSNCMFILEERTEPTLCGLSMVNLTDMTTANKQPFCWFPPDIAPHRLTISPGGSLVVVGCKDGRLLVLNISNVIFSV